MEAQPVDLHLRIETSRDDQWSGLGFDLSSPSRRVPLFRLRSLKGSLPLDPEPLTAQLYEDLEDLLSDQSVGDCLLPGEALTALRSIGKDLYETLLPGPIREVLESTELENVSLLVETDETWIPWEILHTFGEGGDFLCLRYRMGRWLTGPTPPRNRFSNQRILCILAEKVSGLPPLNSARVEVNTISRLAGRHGTKVDVVESPAHSAVLDILRRGGYQSLHFSGHGDFPRDRGADRAALLLEDRKLIPRDLVDEIHRTIREERPLVFLNACRTARRGQSLAGLDGWPDAFVRRGECGGYLAPQWSISSADAEQFSSAFYQSVSDGEVAGEAVRRARIGNHGELSLTSLSYVLYGDPNAVISWRSSVATPSSPDGPGARLEAEQATTANETIPRGAPGPEPQSDERIAEASASGSRRAAGIWRRAAGLLVLVSFVGSLFWLMWTASSTEEIAPSEQTESASTGERVDAMESLNATLESIEHLDTWLAAMFGLVVFLGIVLQVVRKSRVGQFDGSQTLTLFRLVVVLAFVLAICLALVWVVRDQSGDRPQDVGGPTEADRIRQLTLQLKSDDPTAQRQAVEALLPYGRQAADEIVLAISEEAGVVARETWGSASEGGFFLLLGPPPWDTPFMRAASSLLVQIGETAIDPILGQLAKESRIAEGILSEAQRREQAQQDSGDNGSLNAFGSLGFLIESAEKGLRVAIVKEVFAQVLLGMGRTAVPSLLDALESPRLLLKMTSYQVLQQIPGAKRPLAERLREKASHSEDESEARALIATADSIDPQDPG